MSGPRMPLDAGELEAVLAPLDEARGLPAAAYLDEAVVAYERAALFAPSWIYACREADVEQPGSWARARVAGEDILVVRGDDLELRAFYNVCRHRGTPLLVGHASPDPGRARGRAGACIECPYHGWRYSRSGALSVAPHLPRARGPLPDLDLLPVRATVWQGFVFVTCDAAAPDLAAWMGEPPPWLREADLRHLVRAREGSYEVEANWKLLVANFQESHHFPRIHPALERLTPTATATTYLSDGAWLGGIMDIASDTETVSTSGALRERTLIATAAAPTHAAAHGRRRVFDGLLFPAMLTSLQPDYLLVYQLTPIAARRTRVTAEIFVHPTTPTNSLGEVFEFWDVVNAEDRAICERQQHGVASAGYRPGPYTRVDEGVHAFEQLVVRAYLRADLRQDLRPDLQPDLRHSSRP